MKEINHRFLMKRFAKEGHKSSSTCHHGNFSDCQKCYEERLQEMEKLVAKRKKLDQVAEKFEEKQEDIKEGERRIGVVLRAMGVPIINKDGIKIDREKVDDKAVKTLEDLVERFNREEEEGGIEVVSQDNMLSIKVHENTSHSENYLDMKSAFSFFLLEEYYGSDYEHDLRNMPEVERILVEGTKKEQALLGEFYGWDEQEVERKSHFEKMRNRMHEQSRQDVEKRKRNNPEPTVKEYRAGTYREALEPHVRDAVFDLREKGYNTLGSGFQGPDRQLIFFEPVDLEEPTFSDELLNMLEDKGVELDIDWPEQVAFDCKKPLSPDELKNAWDSVVEAMPETGQSAPSSKMENAEGFRKRHQDPEQ